MTQPHELAEHFTQQYIDQPQLSGDYDIELGSQAQKHYEQTGMAETRPAYAHYQSVRLRRMTAWSGLWHVVMTDVVRQIGPECVADSSQLLDKESAETNPYHNLMDTMTEVLHSSSTNVTQGNHSDWRQYEPTWRVVGDLQAKHSQAWLDWAEESETNGVSRDTLSPPSQPSTDISAVWTASAYDIAKTSLWALYNHAVDNPQAASMSPMELTNKALADASVMNWGTTVNRRLGMRLFPNVFTDTPTELEGAFFAAPSQLFEHTASSDDNAQQCQWSHKTLSHGPWRSPHLCAGRIFAHPATTTDQEAVETFFSNLELRTGKVEPRRHDGTFNSGTIAIQLGALLGEHTIYEDLGVIGGHGE